MISAKVKWKKPKLTIEQRITKMVVKEVAKQVTKKIKGEVPTITKALRFGVDYKMISKRGTTSAVVGIKSKFSKVFKKTGQLKIPNKYAKKIEAKYHFLARNINSTLTDKMRDLIRSNVKDLIIP